MANKSTKNSPFQKAFYKWLNENSERFILPVIVQESGKNLFGLSFSGVNPAIVTDLHESGFCAVVELKNGEEWDALISVDALPTATQGGYYDKLTLPEYRKVYSNKEAFWFAELFEPILNWVNNRLAKSKWIALYRWGGIQEATLLQDENMQKRHGEHVFGILGGLRSLDGTVLSDTVTEEDTEKFLLSVHI